MADTSGNPSSRSSRSPRGSSRASQTHRTSVGSSRRVRDELRDIQRARKSRAPSSLRSTSMSDRAFRESQTSVSRGKRPDFNLRDIKFGSFASDRSPEDSDEKNRERASSRSSESSSARSLSNATLRSQNSAIQVFISLIIILIAAIQIFSVFRTYAQNVGQLNSLKKQEAQLIVQKAQLENDIARWSDKAYITTQARQRLGFVFPGEKTVIVKNAPKDAKESKYTDALPPTQNQLPWYTELMYAIDNSDHIDFSSTDPTGANANDQNQQNQLEQDQNQQTQQSQ